MHTRSIAMLLITLVLAGCASTANNYSAKGILLDNGSYYFPAQDGQGDYYYAEPARQDIGFSRFSFDSRFGYGAFGPLYGHACGLRGWGCSPWPYWYGYGRGGMVDPGYGWHWQHGQYDPRYRDPRQRNRRHGREVFPPIGEGTAAFPQNGLFEAPAIDDLAEDDASPIVRRSRRAIPPSWTNDESGAVPARQRSERSGSRPMPRREQSRPRIRESGHDGDGQ